jgi:hypothetical protein
MDTVEKIGTVLPKLKYQLMFLKEREVLMTEISLHPIVPASATSPVHSVSAASILPLETRTDDCASLDRVATVEMHRQSFPDQYIIPTLPNSLLKDIESGHLHKFGPHFSNRQILIDTIVHDLIDQHKLLSVSYYCWATCFIHFASLLNALSNTSTI